MSCGICISVSTEDDDDDDDDDDGGLAMTDIGRDSSSAVVAVACNFILFFSLFVCLFCLVGWWYCGGGEVKYCSVWSGGWVSKRCVLERGRDEGREE